MHQQVLTHEQEGLNMVLCNKLMVVLLVQSFMCTTYVVNIELILKRKKTKTKKHTKSQAMTCFEMLGIISQYMVSSMAGPVILEHFYGQHFHTFNFKIYFSCHNFVHKQNKRQDTNCTK